VRGGLNLPTGHSKQVYNHLDECVRSYCGLIFNPFAALEWVEGRATIESASAIAAVVDSVKLKYITEADYLVYTREVLDQCHEYDPTIKVPDFPVLQKLSDNITLSSAVGILATQVPDYLEDSQRKRFQKNGQIPTEVPVFSVRQWVEETFKWKDKNPETYQERIDGFKTSLSEDIERRDEYFADPRQYRKGWMKGFLKIDRILKAFNPGIDVDTVLDSIDATQCPAVSLYWKVREKRMLSGNPPKDNDVDDYGFIPVVLYADIVLIESNLREFILQADKSLESKVFSSASDALCCLNKCVFTYEGNLYGQTSSQEIH